MVTFLQRSHDVSVRDVNFSVSISMLKNSELRQRVKDATFLQGTPELVDPNN